MTNEKHFLNALANESSNMACLQIYRILSSLATFLSVHSNLEEVSYLSWQNKYPNLKTTCRIKLKFFLWTKLLENPLLTKYLISVAAPLTLKRLRGPTSGFSKNVFSEKRWSPGFFVTFNIIIISHIFPENFMVVPYVVQNL